MDLTDHDTMSDGLKAKGYKTRGFRVIVGSEVKTGRCDVIGLFLSEEIKSKPFLEAIHEIKGQGGLAVMPHPLDHRRGSAVKPNEKEAKLADAMESFNSRCLFKEYNGKAFFLARKLRIGMTAGSDVHFADEIGRAGIATESDDLYPAIVHANIKVFGKRCSAMSYCRALARKLLPEESSKETRARK